MQKGKTLVVTAVISASALFALVGVATGAVLSTPNIPAGGAGGGGFNSSKVPAEFRPWIARAAESCKNKELTGAIIAAQIQQESGFSTSRNTKSSAGALGPAQFMPGTWETWGRDDDGNGKSDPYDVGDAVMAQGRFMCSLVNRAKKSGIESYPWGPIALALAGYNAGWGRVEEYGGVPPKSFARGETYNYVARIMRMSEGFAEKKPKGKFTAPVDTHTSAPYRASGSQWSSGYHTGVDFPVSVGTPVKAIGAGEVAKAGRGGSYGIEVVIKHNDGHYSQYAHLSKMAVKKGTKVKVGQEIGLSGNTGNSTGPHLHFEVRTGPQYGSDIDPVTYLRSREVAI